MNHFFILIHSFSSYLDTPRHISIYHTGKPKRAITQGHAKGKVPSIPDFTTINRRINKLDIPIDNNKDRTPKDEYIIIAIDITDIKVTNRGQWIQDKWNAKIVLENIQKYMWQLM